MREETQETPLARGNGVGTGHERSLASCSGRLPPPAMPPAAGTGMRQRPTLPRAGQPARHPSRLPLQTLLALLAFAGECRANALHVVFEGVFLDRFSVANPLPRACS